MRSVDNSLFLMIDMQEKLLKAVFKSRPVDRAVFMLKACRLLGVPVVVTEQYPTGLGKTVPAICDALPPDAKIFEKMDFSAFQDQAIRSYLEQTGRRRIILGGVEAHICVFQTALDLREAGYDVCLLDDISGSRYFHDTNYASYILQARGIETWTSEMLIFDWMKSARHPQFKAVQALIKARELPEFTIEEEK